MTWPLACQPMNLVLAADGTLGIMECTENDYCGLSWVHGISLSGIVLYGDLWLKVHVTSCPVVIQAVF